MSLRYVLIEVRPNLRCANVFLQFDQSLTETEFLKINVEENAILLREYSTQTKVDVKQHFTIDARTMSNLVVEEINASFRLSVVSSDEQSSDETENRETCNVKPMLEEGNCASIHCSNCKNNLTTAKNDECLHLFERIREYPSGSYEVSEFFCHQHGDTDYNALLVPRVTDLFYGFEFLVLNQQLMANSIKEKQGHVYCKRCLQYLGTSQFENKAHKLWTDALLIRKEAELLNIFGNLHQEKNTIRLMHKIIQECLLDSSEHKPYSLFSTKIFLETTFPNRHCKYLLLHLLEKKLKILRNTQPLAHGGYNNNNVLQVQLETQTCFKLMYKQEDDDQEEQTIKDAWQKDMSIHSMKISPKLFADLLNELEENSKLLPEKYRFTRDEFVLSYIFCN